MHFHLLRDVAAISNKRLVAQFKNGVTKTFDVTPWIENNSAFLPLKDDALFYCVVIDSLGSSVRWNKEIDLSCEVIWDDGETVPTPFDSLMSFTDATFLWGLNESTLRKAVTYGKLIPGIDAKKLGKQWVVTIDAMKREYGNPVMDESRLDLKSPDAVIMDERPFPL